MTSVLCPALLYAVVAGCILYWASVGPEPPRPSPEAVRDSPSCFPCPGFTEELTPELTLLVVVRTASLLGLPLTTAPWGRGIPPVRSPPFFPSDLVMFAWCGRGGGAVPLSTTCFRGRLEVWKSSDL